MWEFTFRNRTEAGEKLAEKVQSLSFTFPQVVAIPRGGVEVAAPIAETVGSDLKLVIPRKVGAPWQEELAVGAVTPDGKVYYNERVMNLFNLTPEALESRVEEQLNEIKSRQERYGQQVMEQDISGKTVLLVDDGIATGFTVLAAAAYLHRMKPDKLYMLTPVAPPDTVERLEEEFEQVICLVSPPDFTAVGAYYQHFEQLGDETVKRILQQFVK